MRIGILTYHRSVNEGSVIQAYCLQQLVQSLVPKASVEIIDYRPSVVEKRDFRKLFSRRPPFVNVGQWNKTKTLHSFLHRHCVLSRHKCQTDDLGKARQFVVEQKYDVIVVGSDTVWRVRQNTGDLLAPNIYYLPDIHGPKKIAFAVSFDLTDRMLLNAHRRRELARMIRDFDFISVRDEMSRRYLREFALADKEFTFMPDPTLLWDFSRIVEPADDMAGDAPLAGVAVPGISVKKQVTKNLREKGYRVVNLLGTAVKGQIEVPVRYSLQKRLGIYRVLDLMVTDRFHGSIFALKLGHAPVIFLENITKYPPDVISKGRDLFRRLEIEWLVHRYTGKDLPHCCIDETLAAWDKLRPDVGKELSKLKNYALPLVTQVLKNYL